MEWKRAKTILIIAFLILDTILGAIILINNSNGLTITNNDIGNCREILKNNNIEFAADIPRKINPLAKLSLDNCAYNDKNLTNGLLNPRNKDISMERSLNDKDIVYYQSPDKKMYTIFHKKTSLIFIRFDYKEIDCNGKKSVILSKIKDMLAKKGINSNYAVLSSFSKTEGTVRANFVENYMGYELPQSELSVDIDATGSVQIYYRWFIPKGINGGSQAVVSPIDAVITAINRLNLNSSGKKVMYSVKLGYAFQSSESMEVASTETFPVWIISVRSSNYDVSIYVNGYNNSFMDIRDNKGDNI